MSNFTLPSGAKPIENPKKFAHQTVGNNQSAPQAVWTSVPSQAPSQNYQPASVGMGAPHQMAVQPTVNAPQQRPQVAPQQRQQAAPQQAMPSYATAPLPPMAPAAPEQPMRQAVPAMNTIPPVASAAAAPLQAYEPVEFTAPEHITQAVPMASTDAPVTLANNTYSSVLSLPPTPEGVWELAERMAKTVFCPVAARSAGDVYYMLVKAASFGLPWTEAFSLFYVIPSEKNGARIGMYVKGKESICRKHGQWTVSVDKTTGVATASGIRYSDRATATVTYDGFDAALRGRLTRNENGDIEGVDKWKDKWPDMLKARALGRLLDRLFSDVLGGVTSVEEMNDMMLEAELRREAVALTKEDSEPADKAVASLTKIRRGKKTKAIEAKPVVEATEVEAAPVAPVAPVEQPTKQAAPLDTNPYAQMQQNAPVKDATNTPLNSLITESTETNPL